jgi:hypothetical protein
MKYCNELGVECTATLYEHMLDIFVKRSQELVDDHMRNYSWDEHLEISKGRRYDRIWCVNHDAERPSKRVWAFIDKTNGDILKPATWKAPAKHSRGNIYEDDSMQFVTYGGPACMDTIKAYYS